MFVTEYGIAAFVFRKLDFCHSKAIRGYLEIKIYKYESKQQ
jgi:hypothetical protein